MYDIPGDGGGALGTLVGKHVRLEIRLKGTFTERVEYRSMGLLWEKQLLKFSMVVIDCALSMLSDD